MISDKIKNKIQIWVEWSKINKNQWKIAKYNKLFQIKIYYVEIPNSNKKIFLKKYILWGQDAKREKIFAN
jgi:hypothetical protein